MRSPQGLTGLWLVALGPPGSLSRAHLMQCFHTGYSKTVLLFTGIQGARVCTNLIHLHETGRLSEDHRIHGEELSQINKAAGAHLINEE